MDINKGGIWVSMSERTPTAGEYRCQIDVHCPLSGVKQHTIEAPRRWVIGDSGHGRWFGGMRPFTEGQRITHWFEPSCEADAECVAGA